ncbi:CdaR family transcriptional regulator [Halobacillus litoralis]|uniref:CdaR family transcriptional regulator n=1 Tax=Halobacillus litoralis TaxID=45668 RepID=UPI002491BE69|nr:sugar diacid recognition domain-containing protein [Halobacillus litoralis]
MSGLTKKIAEDIVRETSLRLNRNVNIMNMEGIIIAAHDERRVGSVHEGAVEVLKKRSTLAINTSDEEVWVGAQPGVNLPIVFNNEILGVIGITGDPDEMGDIGDLVKMTTELMIRQEFLVSQMEWKQRTKEMIIEQLIKSAPSLEDIHRGLNLLGLQLHPPFTTIVIQIKEQPILNRVFIQKLETCLGNNQAIVGFINVNRVFIALSGHEEEGALNKVKSIYHLMKRLNIVFRMSYSLTFQEIEKFSQSYLDCDITLKISDSDNDLLSFAQIEAKALFFQIDEVITKRFSQRVLKSIDENKAETLNSFFKNNLNLQQTANDLYVHRNTLLYRMNNIIKETGYDPKKFEDALILQVAMWIYNRPDHSSKL